MADLERRADGRHIMRSVKETGTSLVDDHLTPEALDRIIYRFYCVFPVKPGDFNGENFHFPSIEFREPDDRQLTESQISEPLLFCPPDALTAEPKITVARSRSGKSIEVDLSTAVRGGPKLRLIPAGPKGFCNEYILYTSMEGNRRIVFPPQNRITLGKQDDPAKNICRVNRLMIVCIGDSIYITDAYTRDYSSEEDIKPVVQGEVASLAVEGKEDAAQSDNDVEQWRRLRQGNSGRKKRLQIQYAQDFLGQRRRKPSERKLRRRARRASSPDPEY